VGGGDLTILEPIEKWPQYYFWRTGDDGFLREYHEDKTLYLIICEAIAPFVKKKGVKPSTLFLGPRAKSKLKEEMSQSIMVKNSSKLLIGEKPQYMGLNIVFTIDDGIWMA